MYRKNFALILDDYFESNQEDFSKVYLLGTKNKILEYLKKYLVLRPERINEVNNIIDNIDELMVSKYSREVFIDILEAIVEEKFCDSFENAIQLLTLSEEDGLKYLKSRDYTKKKCSSIHMYLKKRFPNQTEELNYIENILKKYIDEKENNTSRTTYLDPKNYEITTEEYYSALNRVINSPYSIEDYCSITGDRLNTYYTPCYRLKRYKNNDEIVREVESRDWSKTINVIREIMFEFIMSDEADMLYYYKKTKLHPDDFKTLFKKIVTDSEIIKDVISKISNEQKKIKKVNKESEINSKSIINGREITKEEKEMIFDYLEENDYPIDLYLIALRKYANEELIISKNKTLKK